MSPKSARAVGLCLAALIGQVFLGCGSDAAPGSTQHECDAGEQSGCECSATTIAGIRTCSADGKWSQCLCDGAPNGECIPGASAACAYAGPAEAIGKGYCVAGKQTCDESRKFGLCAGEVLPLDQESCFTSGDDDCDGEVNEGCVCAPSTSMVCYDGPAGTQDVGLCKGGTSYCAQDGTSYGPCYFQITPQEEWCKTAADENCDGQSPACSATDLWSMQFAVSPSDQYWITSLDVGKDDSVVIAGLASLGVLDFGGGPVQTGWEDGFLAKL